MEQEKEIHRSPVNAEQTYLLTDLEHKRCPMCGHSLSEVSAKVEVKYVYWLYQDFAFCSQCQSYYLTPSRLRGLFLNVKKRFSNAPEPFFTPSNIEIVRDDNQILYIPKEMLDKNKYNRRNLPPRVTRLYEPTDTEYEWICRQYNTAPATRIKISQTSILASEGYNVNVPEELRRSIIDLCVKKHGKEAILKSLNFTVDMRIRQAGGRNKYANSISVWQSDIQYIENRY